MARRTLRRLVDWRLLDVLPRVVGGVRAGSSGWIYYLGPAGRRLLARQGFEARRLGVPGDRHLRHTLAGTELIVRLGEAERGGRFELIEYQTEPRCWRGYLGPWGSRQILKPDLYVRLGVGAYELRGFLEVDLATESKATIARKAWRYINYYQSSGPEDVFPLVVWAVPNERREGQITEVLIGLPAPASKLFIVIQFDELIGRLAEEVRR